jgi:hypothetical protein
VTATGYEIFTLSPIGFDRPPYEAQPTETAAAPG